MGVVTFKVDSLYVFHPSTAKHAGTLELVERIEDGVSTYGWTWKGGPQGHQEGDYLWEEKDNLTIDLDSVFARTRKVMNKSWRSGTSPPRRPWFKRSDFIGLIDPGFSTRPDWPNHFIWKCTLQFAAPV